MVIIGPCSIHDPVAGIDYARRLKRLADEVSGHPLCRDEGVLRKTEDDDGLEGFSSTTRGWTTPS